MGYLICRECNGYYELQPGEKPQDFTNECECGGELVYLENIENELNESKTTKCPKCGTKNPSYANYCQECREKLSYKNY